MKKKTIFVLRIAFIILVVFITVFLLAYSPDITDAVKVAAGGHSLTKAYDWYILPQKDGKPPLPNDRAGFIKDYDALYIGNTNEKVIYLTFDAGYENGFTAGMLDILKKHKVPAAFFLVGNYIKMNPELVKRMIAEGHLVCNHSMHHKDMAKLTEFQAFKDEIEQLETLYKQTTGKDMTKFFRPPEGRFSELSLKYAQELGYTTVFWSFAYVDWYNDKQPSSEEAVSKVIGRTHPGEIALLHATSKTNAQILDEVLTKWESMGFSFKSLTDLKKQ